MTSTRSCLDDYRVRMRRGPRNRSVAAALALGGLLAWAPTGDARRGGSGRPSSMASLGGVNIVGLTYASRPAEADEAIAAARQLHARVVRTEVPWAVMEPGAPNRIDPHALAFTD